MKKSIKSASDYELSELINFNAQLNSLLHDYLHIKHLLPMKQYEAFEGKILEEYDNREENNH